MPSIAEEPFHSPSNGRKRRREDPSEVEIQMKLSSTTTHPQRHHATPHYLEPSTHTNLNLQPQQHSEIRKIVPTKAKRAAAPLHENKKPRLLEALQRNPESRQESNRNEEGKQQRQASVDLNPCHICHRKPTVRSELDAFADCEGCGLRTCFVCIRECEGGCLEEEMGEGEEELAGLGFSWNEGREMMGLEHEEDRRKKEGDGKGNEQWVDGRILQHRRMICSRCCVEKGKDGEVWCLGCLRAEEGA